MSTQTDVPLDVAAAPDPSVAAALSLGWDMATMQAGAQPRGGREHPHRDDLATLSDLNGWEWTEIRLSSVAVALVTLTPAFEAVGLTAPPLDIVRDVYAGDHKAALTGAVEALHSELMVILYAASPRLGKAYTLGRSLAYTTLKPTDPRTLEQQLSAARLSTLQAWLADLATALPAHSARAVAVSLEMWQEAIPDPAREEVAQSAGDGAAAAEHVEPPLPTAPDLGNTLAPLHRQGALWRDLLTGEKAGEDMLSPSDYLNAGSRMMASVAGLTRSFIAQHWAALGTGVLLTVAVIAVVLLSAAGSGSKVVGSIAAAAAALGVSWSAVRASLGKTLAKLEQPLWQAELDTAIAEAITVIPPQERGVIAAAGVAAELHPRGPAQAAS